VNRLKKAVINIVIGISSSTTFTLTAMIPNTESNKATVMTYRKRVIKSIIRFQSLKENGTTKAIRNKT
jgi:hypothetical protein